MNTSFYRIWAFLFQNGCKKPFVVSGIRFEIKHEKKGAIAGHIYRNTRDNMTLREQLSSILLVTKRRSTPVTALMLLLLVVFSSLQKLEAQDRSQDLSSQLAAKYESVETMKARFVQTATSSFLDEDEYFSGVLTFSQEKFRVETSSQTIITNGTTTWIHNRGERQVLINDYVEDEGSFSLTTFLRQFDQEYESETDGQESLGGVMHDRLVLRPLDDFSSFQSVRLWVRKSDLIVTHLIVIDLNDVTMTFDLSEIQVNPELDPQEFEFEIPESVEIIDLRN